jgi:hypothetical protein
MKLALTLHQKVFNVTFQYKNYLIYLFKIEIMSEVEEEINTTIFIARTPCARVLKNHIIRKCHTKSTAKMKTLLHTNKEPAGTMKT